MHCVLLPAVITALFTFSFAAPTNSNSTTSTTSSPAPGPPACVSFDSNGNLLAFGFNGKDYNAGTQDTWTSGTNLFLTLEMTH